MNQFKLGLTIMSWVIGLIAIIMLYCIDWKIALGVFLWSWSTDLERASKKY